METVFPTDEGFAGFFLVGFRKDPDEADPTQAEIQRTGTVILKRTYDIDPTNKTLTPSDPPLPILMQDVPDNVVVNGNFEASQKVFGESEDDTKPAVWQAEDGVTATLASDQGKSGTGDTALQVTGDANKRIVQTIQFDEALGGRTFTLSFWAKADDTPATIQNVRLEIDGHAPICSITRALPKNSMTQPLPASGTWPASVQAKEMRVVLRMATNAARTVFYDDVQVEERDYLSVDPITALRYEHDLAPYKPQADVIVLGFTELPEPPNPPSEVVRLLVNSTKWFERSLNSSRPKAVFGWEPRQSSIRKGQAGTYPAPPGETLPPDFDNLFYNGYLRSATTVAQMPYLAKSAHIVIERDIIGDHYRFSLQGETIGTKYYYYTGTGPDKESRWKSQDVSMGLDTLVIEPDQNRCYAVWRGVWNFDERSDDAYRRLVVSVEEA